MWLLACGSAFVAGVALGATRDPAWAVILCPTIAFSFLSTSRSRTTVPLLIAAVLLFGMLGVLRYEHSLSQTGTSLVSHYNDSGKVSLEAVICEEPDHDGRYTRVLLDDVRIEDGGRFVPVHGKVLVTTADPRPLHYGTAVSFVAALESPMPIDDFDYSGYLALRGIYSTAFCPGFEVLPADTRQQPRAWLMSFNTRLGKAMASVLPQPEASLAQSLLLGRRAGLPESLASAFARTGTAHLLAISGLHLGIIVAAALVVLLAAMGRRHYLYVWIALLVLWSYAVFTGLRPPVVRAAIMASTFLLAELAGRQRHGPTALAVAAAVMVGIEPQLLWQTSFQLSVLAMGGLILLYSPLQTSLQRLLAAGNRGFQADTATASPAVAIVSATLAATIAIWPVCAVTFGQVSLLGVPVSLLTLPMLPFALGSSAIAGIIALLSPAAATPFSWLAWLFLTYIVKVVHAFSLLPWAVIEPTIGGGWFIAGYFALLSAVPLIWHRMRNSAKEGPARSPEKPDEDDRRGRRLRWAIPPLLLAAVLVWSAVLSAPDGRLHVIFLDVGQGDSALVISPSGVTILIDGGADGRDTCQLIDSQLPFWRRNLDVVVATHPHADHIGGLLTAVERYQIGLVLDPCLASTTLISEEWARRLSVSDVTPTCITAGHEVLVRDGVHLEILHPARVPLSGTSDDSDNNSVVIRITYGEISFLFTADIRTEAERHLVHHQSAALRNCVLKVPHHGSNSSSSAQFLAAVFPAMAVVSAGSDNLYGHPHEDVLERLSTGTGHVLNTADYGTIEFVTDGRQLWVKTERAAPVSVRE